MQEVDKPWRRKLVLGSIHLLVGCITLTSRAWGGSGLINSITHLASSLPFWSLFLAGILKGLYGIGGILPGTTYMVLFILGHECSLSSASSEIAAISIGVFGGASISYLAGNIWSKFGFPAPRDPAPKQQRWQGARAFFLATHPNLVATYLFELGYFNKPFRRPALTVGAYGVLILSIYMTAICSFKTSIKAATGDIGTIWGLALILWGLWRIIGAILERRKSSGIETPNGT